MTEVEIDTIKIKISIEGKEDASIAGRKVTKPETADKKDIPMEEETEGLDIKADLDQDHLATTGTVEEENTTEVSETEAMKIKEGEEEREEAEMITEDIHLTVEVIAMIAEKMEREIQEITEKKTTAEVKTPNQIQDTLKTEDPGITDTAVKRENMDLKNL
jgi:hypothetical protein